MSCKIRIGVEMHLAENRIQIISDWSDHEREVLVSRKDLAVAYSASVLEIGMFLRDCIGMQYEEVIKVKRQKFFSRVGMSRRKHKAPPREISEELKSELKRAADRRLRSLREKDDMTDEELEGISARLRERLKDKPVVRTKYRKMVMDSF